MEFALAIYGGVTGTVALSDQLQRLCRKLRKIAKSVKYAERDIGKIADEMSIFSKIFEDFQDMCFNNQDPNKTDRCAIDKLFAWATSAKEGLKALVKKLRALTSKRHKASLTEKIAAHVMWYLSQSNLNCLRAALSVARESMNGFMNIRTIEILSEQLKLLRKDIATGKGPKFRRRNGMTVEILEQRLRNRYSVQRGVGKSLDNAIQRVNTLEKKHGHPEFIPKPDTLLVFAESVGDYVDEVVPRRESVLGRRSSSSTYSFKHETQSTSTRRDGSRRSTVSTESSSNAPSITNRSHTVSTKTSSIQSSQSSTSLGHGSSSIPNSSPNSSRASSSKSPSKATSTAEQTQTSDVTRAHRSRHDFRVKEYRNDPEGDILSPPIVKGRPSLEPRRGMVKSGAAVGQDVPESSAENRRHVKPPGNHIEAYYTSENDMTESDTKSEDDEEQVDQRPSPFHPIAGVVGRRPPRWDRRHERSESPQDFW